MKIWPTAYSPCSGSSTPHSVCTTSWRKVSGMETRMPAPSPDHPQLSQLGQRMLRTQEAMHFNNGLLLDGLL